jgi:pentose-5-phosphate-3-epimerase
MINNTKGLKTIDEVVEKMPQVKPLIDKQNLEIETDGRQET